MPVRMPPRMITGMSSGMMDALKDTKMSHRLKCERLLGRQSFRASDAMTAMQATQIMRPGTMPAAKSPAMDTPMSEP